MNKFTGLLLVLTLVLLPVAAGADWKVISQKTVTGLGHPESVAFDAQAKAFYVSRFGSELKPLQKDGQGFISRLDLSGQVLEERFLPAEGETLNKPKGVWTSGGRLWTTDIDAVWIFDLATKKGRKLDLPGAGFANDVVEAGGKLYVSDTKTGAVYLIQPADFLSAQPQISILAQESDLAPNGLWAIDKDQLLAAGSPLDGGSGAIYRLSPDGRISDVSPDLGRLDGLAVLKDGTILYTDWAGQGLFALGKEGKPQPLAQGFGGPADFAVVPREGGCLVVVPDLVKGEIRLIELSQ